MTAITSNIIADFCQYVTIQPPLPGSKRGLGNDSSWMDMSAIGDDPFIPQAPSPPQAGEKGLKKYIYRVIQECLAYQNPRQTWYRE